MFNWLNSLINYETNKKMTKDEGLPSLEKTNLILENLGSPQNSFPTINVTGTNGKGSVVLAITQLLTDLGLKVGSFTSPHLKSVNERIRISNEDVSDELLSEALMAVKLIAENTSQKPTYFEALCAASCYIFENEAVDVAVFEVGIGGTWDSTNFESDNEGSHDHVVITAIGYDHTDVLGETLEEIARDKSGLIKPNSTVVLGDIDEDFIDVILDKRHQESLLFGQEYEVFDVNDSIGGQVFSLKNRWGVVKNILLPQFGKHQITNTAIALTCVMSFLNQPVSIDDINISLSQIKNRGRFEVLSKNPLVVFDGAHNPMAAKQLSQTLEESFGLYSSVTYILGFKAGKDIHSFLDELQINDEDFIFVASTNYENMVDAKDLEIICKEYSENVLRFDSKDAALDYALNSTLDDGQIIITGSMYLY